MNNGLIIKKQWLDLILEGKKTWELRGSKTKKREEIYLIESGSGEIKGSCKLVDCIGPLSQEQFNNNTEKHLNLSLHPTYKKTYAWVLTEPKRFEKGIKYNHPQGAIIWVNLNP
jgi:hypothetical protein